jgi:DNA-directed RNA polymerase specialized sigma24 family protein
VSCSPWQTDLAAARAGDCAALGRLLDSLRGYLRHIASDGIPVALLAKADVADLVQQTFLEAIKDFGRFDGSSADDWRVWVRGLLRHVLSHFRRDFNRLCRLAQREVSLERAVSGSGGAVGLVVRAAPPDE